MRDRRRTFVRLIAVLTLSCGTVAFAQTKPKPAPKAHRARSSGHHHTREQRSICRRVAAERCKVEVRIWRSAQRLYTDV